MLLFKLVVPTLVQMVASRPLVQQIWDLVPSEIEHFIMKILNLGSRRNGDV